MTEPVRYVTDDLTVEGVMEVAERFPSKEQLWLAGNNCCSFVEWLEEEVCVDGDECDIHHRSR